MEDKEKQRPRRRRKFTQKRFKSSYLNPDTVSQAGENPESDKKTLLTQPLEVRKDNLVPWMDAYNSETREVLLHQAATRAKARNPPEPIPNMTRSPLDFRKKELLIKRSLSQSTVPRAEMEDGFMFRSARANFESKTLDKVVLPPVEKAKPKLIVKGRSTISAPEDSDSSGPLPPVYTSPLENTAFPKRESMKMSHIRQADGSGFKYFNSSVIPERPAKKVSLNEVRSYIWYLERKTFK